MGFNTKLPSVDVYLHAVAAVSVIDAGLTLAGIGAYHTAGNQIFNFGNLMLHCNVVYSVDKKVVS